MVTKADKGNSLVIIHCDEYEHKLNNFISKNKATETNHNLTAKFQKDLRSTPNECRQIIDKNNKWKYINLNPCTPLMRGLIKRHTHSPNRELQECPNLQLNKGTHKCPKEIHATPLCLQRSELCTLDERPN